MANERKPSLYVDRGMIGSSDELDEYGVWVKSEPQDISSPGIMSSDDDFAVPEMEDFPDFDDLEAEMNSSYGKSKIDDSLDIDFSSDDDDFDNLVSLDTEIKDDDYSEVNLHDFIGPIDDTDTTDVASSKDLSTQLLMKIANELSTIRAELGNIKREFSRLGPLGTSGGDGENFFDASDDEKIVLTGDEMDNILNNSDFSEQNEPEEVQSLDDTELDNLELDDLELDELEPIISETDEEEDISDLDLSDLDGSDLDTSELDTSELDASELDTSELDLSELDTSELDDFVTESLEMSESEQDDALGLDDLTDLSDLEEVESFDPMESSLEETEDDLDIPELDTLDDLADFGSLESETSESETGEIDTSVALEELTEDFDSDLLEETESLEVNDLEVSDLLEETETLEDSSEEQSGEGYDLSGYENLQFMLESMDKELDEEINLSSDTLEDVDLSDLDSFEIESESDTVIEPEIDTEIDTELEDFNVSGLEPIELDIDEPDFTDFETNDLEELEVEESAEDGNDLSLIPEAMEGEVDELDLELAPRASSDSEISPLLKEELKSVLSYMDQLLESLPDDKIEEFARSEYFETYKKLFKELGIV